MKEVRTMQEHRISINRQRELYHFAMQYPEWKKKAGTEAKCRSVERAAMEAAPDLCEWILLGVTDEKYTYSRLRAMGIPCGRNLYFEKRMRFYELLDEMKP